MDYIIENLIPHRHCKVIYGDYYDNLDFNISLIGSILNQQEFYGYIPTPDIKCLMVMNYLDPSQLLDYVDVCKFNDHFGENLFLLNGQYVFPDRRFTLDKVGYNTLTDMIITYKIDYIYFDHLMMLLPDYPESTDHKARQEICNINKYIEYMQSLRPISVVISASQDDLSLDIDEVSSIHIEELLTTLNSSTTKK